MTVLGDILTEVTFTRVLLFGSLFLLVSFIVDLLTQPRYPSEIPVLGHSSEKWFSRIRNSLAYFTQHQAWIGEGYEKYGKNGLPFIAPAPISRPPDVILPRSQIAWMMDQPDRILSASHAHDKILYTEYNFLGKDLAAEPFANRVMHKYLARNLSSAIPAVEDEVNGAVEHALETMMKAAAEKDPKNVDSEGYTKVNLWDLWLAIVPRVTNRLLVGSPACQNPDILKPMVSFTDNVVMNSFLLHGFPQVLHPIIGRLITIPNYLHWRKASRVLLPIIEQRLKDMQRQEAGDPEMKNYTPPEDFITWDIRLAMAEKKPFELNPIVISKRLLPINFAAIHTTVLTGQSWMLDFLSSPPSVLETLRNEILEHKPSEGHWTKQALSSLVRVDSSIRESQRVSNFAANLIERQVIAPEGLHHPDYGWTLPRGAFVTVNLQGTHHDDEIYEDAMSYDPWRYSRVREEWEAKSAEEKQEREDEAKKIRGLGMVTTSDAHLAFGHGRHACPGRFFVAHELKLIMAAFLLNYDIKTLEKRPKPQWMGATIIPPLDACIEIRRKKST
ncbi:cytochrome P450 monooxygenase [Fusarium tjaetaba]|uniref:Cytochrome P450 monooxygenase n=1 Tax=Fusarium tjaetaba TaxID=1567544 RepID=A0A8H5RAA1_9HYPO|nr:cytochrome P450 monooxygenase [Fusarium tjaetaba]KAF5628266.1 cytochrome P450 monooxygenase [Fusarium tjaetaba]